MTKGSISVITYSKHAFCLFILMVFIMRGLMDKEEHSGFSVWCFSERVPCTVSLLFLLKAPELSNDTLFLPILARSRPLSCHWHTDWQIYRHAGRQAGGQVGRQTSLHKTQIIKYYHFKGTDNLTKQIKGPSFYSAFHYFPADCIRHLDGEIPYLKKNLLSPPK